MIVGSVNATVIDVVIPAYCGDNLGDANSLEGSITAAWAVYPVGYSDHPVPVGVTAWVPTPTLTPNELTPYISVTSNSPLNKSWSNPIILAVLLVIKQ